ncbi:MAG TPA: NADH-quinone oxidoreductase subunit J [Chloroflexota bacterium]|nr:NADH-quinone oxidoreductase subunit J [Chloroflexota bacterium]
MDVFFAPVMAACVLALLSALCVVTARGAIRAVVALLAHSLSIAALYALLAAGLVAVGQLLIYSGAIVVLFLFVVALLPPGGRELTSQPLRLTAGVLVGLALLAALFTAIQPSMGGGLQLVAPNAPIGSVAGVGHQLFDYGKLLAPFELTAPLLLVAIVGSVALWRRQGAPS